MSDTEDTFDKLHAALTDTLLDRIENGEKVKTKDGEIVTIPVPAATLNVARQWLNDNQIAADPTRNSRLKKLAKGVGDLPFDTPQH